MDTKALRAALYLRVSTDGQTVENQRLALMEEADRRGWIVVDTFEDAGISGSKGRDKRPGFDRMLKAASRGKFDVLQSWSLDRLGRSMFDVLGAVRELDDAKVQIFLRAQEIDTTRPEGRLFFHMTAAFAEFERGRIVDRIQAGITRARKVGTKSGLAIGRPRIDPATEAKVKAALGRLHRGEEGAVGMLKIAKIYGIGGGTVQRLKAEMVSAGDLV